MKPYLFPKFAALTAVSVVASATAQLPTPPVQTSGSCPPKGSTVYPIDHVVVIFQENISFDHYFATYPKALNPKGEPKFVAKPDTPSINGLSPALLTHNQNKLQPKRLGRDHASTSDQNHEYEMEQKAFNHGMMNKFVEYTGVPEKNGKETVVMDYFDGNTVTALWNYAQNYAMNDNSFGSVPGPSTPGAINLVSGQTHGAYPEKITAPGAQVEQGTIIGDALPLHDSAAPVKMVEMRGRNIGDLLNAKKITWGWFQGGFDQPKQTHTGADGKPKTDYIPHHEPFQYYRSTANPDHKPPTSVQTLGQTDQANHQYDILRFWAALYTHHLPAVSFLKAPGYQDGHPGYSNPLLEQEFVVETINRLMRSPEWKNMAIIIAYDDSDGWYDHVMPPSVNSSQTGYDFITGNGESGANQPLGGYQARYSLGPRMPLLVISPFSKINYVDHTVTDQCSVLQFIEDNWKLGRIGDSSFDARAGTLLNMFDFEKKKQCPSPAVILDPGTGTPLRY
jgi:phospholipase C